MVEVYVLLLLLKEFSLSFRALDVIQPIRSSNTSTLSVPHASTSIGASTSLMLFSAQLNWLEPSPPTFFCFIFCSVFVPL
jgi:hypothetical protein